MKTQGNNTVKKIVVNKDQNKTILDLLPDNATDVE